MQARGVEREGEGEREVRGKGSREKEGSRDGVSNVSTFARAASALQLNHQAEKWPQGGKVRDEERERRKGNREGREGSGSSEVRPHGSASFRLSPAM